MAAPTPPQPAPPNTEAVRPDSAAPSIASRPSKFRFKSSHRSPRRDDSHGEDGVDKRHDRHRSRHHHHHHHHHHHKRRRSRSPSTSPTPEPASNDQKADGGALDTDAAFRESLFDALADDEGAAYWEGVYGQPIHIYARPGSGSRSPDGAAHGGGGDAKDSNPVHGMTDDEYAAYVRQKMWEKTHAGLLEERARRARERAAREKDDQEFRMKEREARRVADEMERSLRLGEERRRERAWRDGWERYLARWKTWQGDVDGIAWPVRSGKMDDVGPDEVKTFFVRGLRREDMGEKEFSAKLRDERVRWHPDKMQQRLGGIGMQVDGGVMGQITAAFQIIDQLWADTRP